jgi:membrane protease YdiL (CAAX protease family)
VFAEEAFFRGWLQPRLGRHGPVLSAVLWGGYHLQQTSTIPSLILFGLALGALRWWRGTVRIGAGFHFVGDAAFFLSTYA